MRGGLLAGLVAVALLAPVAGAHDAHQNEGLDDQLVDAGEGLMVGAFDAPQQGPLLVVPYVHGPMPCGRPAQAAHAIPVGGSAGVAFAMNATHVQATLDLPPNATGYLAFALDTTDAIRSIMMMLEHAIAMHRMGAAVLEPGPNATTNLTFRDGWMGVPYLLPGAENATVSSKYFVDIPMPGDGVRMDYAPAGPASTCQADAPGHVTVRFDRRMIPALSPGAIVHGMVLWDPEVPYWLPRPVDSTHEFQVNLYLTRSTENPGAIQRALDPAPTPQNTLALSALAVGLLWVAWPTRGSRP